MLAKSPSLLRHEWLEKAGAAIVKLIESQKIDRKISRRKKESDAAFDRRLAKSPDQAMRYKVPKEVRISIGTPKGAHGGKKAIGICYAPIVTKDQHIEIFVSPELGHGGRESVEVSVRVMGVLAHEYCHAACGNKAGHRKPFQELGGAIGLVGPWTATTEGPDFNKWAAEVVKSIGKYPAGALDMSMRPKASTRLLKCLCNDCGYIARVTAKWVNTSGAPMCPTDKVSMTCDAVEDDDEEGDD